MKPGPINPFLSVGQLGSGRAVWHLTGYLLLLAGLAVQIGCHGLRSRRQTQALSNARQNSLRGAEKLQQNKLRDAEFLFSEALRHSAADERAQWGMAEVLWQQGERGKAIEHMSQAAAISGENPELLVRLGEMNLEQGRLQQALDQADSALEGGRRNAGAWALRGRALQARGELEEAMICFHRALGFQPNSPSVQLALAEIYQGLGRPQRALATLETMTDYQSADQICPQAWLLKGQALAALGESSAAKHHFKNAALCARDDDMRLLLDLAESQLAAGDLSEARVCLGRVLRANPYDPDALRIQNDLDAVQRSRQSARGSLVGFAQPE